MLLKRWNKNGSVVNCELSQLKEMEKNGYDLKICPNVEEKEDKKKNKKNKKKKEEVVLKDKLKEKEVEPEVGIILE